MVFECTSGLNVRMCLALRCGVGALGIGSTTFDTFGTSFPVHDIGPRLRTALPHGDVEQRLAIVHVRPEHRDACGVAL